MIDVNGSRHHLLLGERDWRQPLLGSTHLAWEGSSVVLEPRLSAGVGRADVQGNNGDRPQTGLTAEQRRGAAADRHGNLYWISADRTGVEILPARGGAAVQYFRLPDFFRVTAQVSDFRPWRSQAENGGGGLDGEAEGLGASPGTPSQGAGSSRVRALSTARLSGLTVTCYGWLVVGTLGPSGLLCLDLAAGAGPLWWRWPELSPIPFAPFDMASLPDGGLLVLDRQGDRLWRLDRNLCLVPISSSSPGRPRPGSAYGASGSESTGSEMATPEPGSVLTLRRPRSLDFVPLEDPAAEGSGEGAGGAPEVNPAPDDPPVQEKAEISIGGWTLPAPLDLAFASPPGGTARAVLTLPDGSWLILADGGSFSRLHRFADGEPRGVVSLEDSLRPWVEEDAPVATGGGSSADPGSAGSRDDLLGHDMTFLPGATDLPGVADSSPGLGSKNPSTTFSGELLLSDVSGGRAVALAISADPEDFEIRPLARELPLVNHGGRALVRVPLGESLAPAGSHTAGRGGCCCGQAHGVYGAGVVQGAGGGGAAAWRDSGPAYDALYDSGEHWLPVAEMPHQRRREHGTVAGLIFDGRSPSMVWHRLIFDGCVPSGCGIRVESRSAEELGELLAAPFRPEPVPVRRASGSELPYADHRRPSGEGWGSFDLLFQAARGRYLELRLIFVGDGRRSPALRALRVYYPRFSYLQEYLPAVWSEDPEAASLTDRFLANLEGLWTALEAHIAHVELLFDPRTAPPEWLEWLGSWVGAVFDSTWSESRRRLFIAHAVELFRWRGTPRGLLAMLHLALDPCVDAASLGLPSSTSGELAGADSPAAEKTGCAPRARGADRSGIRLVESYATRTISAVALGDPTQAESLGPDLIRADAPWQPSQGAAALHSRYARFLEAESLEDGSLNDDGFDAEALFGRRPAFRSMPAEKILGALERGRSDLASARHFPPLPPKSPTEASRWRAFVATELAFPYAEVAAGDVAAWRRFLAERFRRFDTLLAHWPAARIFGTFEALPLPTTLPSDQTLLFEWMRFASVVLPTARRAHRFTVLIPASPDQGLATRQARLRLAERVVGLEKPSHTEFEVRLYWALFRVGTARLGFDTTVGEGSRFVAQSLGDGSIGSIALGEGYLDDDRVSPNAHPTAAARPLGVDPRACSGRF